MAERKRSHDSATSEDDIERSAKRVRETLIAPRMEIRGLVRMYGKNQPSNSKMRAYEEFKKSRNYSEIAVTLGVQEATAEVYTIDALAAGAPLDALAAGAPLDHTRMANLLEISGEAFDRIKAAITSNANAKLGAIQADLIESFSYNQIRFVLACMIRELAM